MDTIWMDPVEMESAVQVLARQAAVLRDSVTGLPARCTCAVPPSLAGWLDEELLAMAEDALRVAVGYLLDALDVALRRELILVDQSLVAAQAGLLPVPAGATIGGDSGFVLGQATAMGTGMLSAPSAGAAGAGSGFVLHSGPAFNPYLTGRIGAVGGLGLSDVPDPADITRTTLLSGTGVTYSNGSLVDKEGDHGSIGSLAGANTDASGDPDL